MIPQLLVIIFFIILLFVGFKAKSNNNLMNFYNDNVPKLSPNTKKKHKRTRKKKK